MDISKFTRKGKILMLALDHRGSFVKLIDKDHPERVKPEDVVNVKRQIIEELKDDFSGILLDPESGLSAYHKKKPYLLCMEKTGYLDSNGERVTELEYTAESLRTLGADGIKLLIYFNPQAASARKQLETARQALADSRAAGLPLFLEIVTYDLEKANNHKPELVVDSLNMFLEAGIIADVFKLEYPGDPASCFYITRLLKKTPWILLTKGENYAKFRDELKTAAMNGASGFLAGRAVWQEFGKYPADKRPDFFRNVARERFREISATVLEAQFPS